MSDADSLDAELLGFESSINIRVSYLSIAMWDASNFALCNKKIRIRNTHAV